MANDAEDELNDGDLLLVGKLDNSLIKRQYGYYLGDTGRGEACKPKPSSSPLDEALLCPLSRAR
jgi:hypothetical protein